MHVEGENSYIYIHTQLTGNVERLCIYIYIYIYIYMIINTGMGYHNPEIIRL